MKKKYSESEKKSYSNHKKKSIESVTSAREIFVLLLKLTRGNGIHRTLVH